MKALILGAGGQVGGALVQEAPQGVEIVVVRRDALDITRAEAVEAAITRTGPDVVFNAAGYTAVDKAESDAAAAFLVNGEAVEHLTAAVQRSGARLIQVSTDFVFDGRASRPYRPDDPTGPLSVYGASKLAGERAALAATDALVVRTAWLHAATGDNFVRTMLRLFAERACVAVVADQVGTPTCARSLARALWSLAATGVSGLHHYTDAGVASWYDFAVAVREEGSALGLCPQETRIDPVRTEDHPTAAQRPAYSVLDKTAAWDLIGRPARHWRDEVRDTLRRIRADALG